MCTVYEIHTGSKDSVSYGKNGTNAKEKHKGWTSCNLLPSYINSQ